MEYRLNHQGYHERSRHILLSVNGSFKELFFSTASYPAVIPDWLVHCFRFTLKEILFISTFWNHNFYFVVSIALSKEAASH